MTLDMPKDIETNIGNLLSSERDQTQYIVEYVRLVFSNLDLTVEEYQENQLLEPTINKWVKDWLVKQDDEDEYGGDSKEFAQRFMRAVCFSNNQNWYLVGEGINADLAQSQRNYFLFTEEWIPVIKSWYEMFRPYFVADPATAQDDGDIDSYYWAKEMGANMRSILSSETARWWYDYFKDSVDSDGDPYLQYGMQEFLQYARFVPLDVLVAFSKEEKSRDLDMDELLRYNYNLQTIEDFQVLGNIKHSSLESSERFFESWENHRLDLDYYLMNRAANPEILDKLLSEDGLVAASLDWDYLSMCQTIDYAFMTKHGVVGWLKSTINTYTFYEKLASIIVNSNLSEADIQHLTKQSLSDVTYINWKTDDMVLDFLPLSFVKRTFEAYGKEYSNSRKSDFFLEYNCCLVAYLSNPNIKPRRDSTGQLDFNFLTGSDSEDLLECPNHPASPFYFLSTSTFTNPAFTRQDLLDFMSYWQHLVFIGGGSTETVANFPLDRLARLMLATPLWVESEVNRVKLYSEHPFHADGKGYLLTGLFHAENLKIRDLVNYLKKEEEIADEITPATDFNPFYQCYLLANPNIFKSSTVGLFNWWGSVVR